MNETAFRSVFARSLRLSVLLILASTPVAAVVADEIDVRLARAKTEHAHALAAALKTLETDLATNLEQLAQTGNYDVVKNAAAERDALSKDGILPSSEAARPLAAKYVDARRAADSVLFNVYRECVADLTRELKLDRAGAVDEEMKAFVEAETSLLAAGRIRSETEKPVESDRSPETVRGAGIRERHVRSCREIAAAFAELERAIVATRTLDTTARQSAAYATAVSAATEKVQALEFDLCYRIDDVKSDSSERWTMLIVSMDYRPEVVEHVPMAGFLERIRVPLPRARAGEISPGTYVHLRGTLRLDSSTGSMASEAYRPRAVYYQCKADERWYSAYLDIQDMRIVKEVPRHLVAEDDATDD